MKLSPRRKKDRWDRYGIYTGRYKNFKVKISEASNTFGGIAEYYYVLMDSDKHEMTFNSLWEGSKFNSVDEAKEYAINWINQAIK